MSESTAIQPVKNGKDVRVFLEGQIEKIAAVCNKYLKPARVIQLAAICAYKTPKLALCDQPSILSSVLQGAELGLNFSPSAGEAYLIPRWNKKLNCYECQFQVGYQGLCKLARECGTRYIAARVVHSNDEITWEYSPEPVVRHVPCRGKDAGPVTDVYAVARVESGELVGDWMSREDVERIRARSESPNSGPWVTDWDEMARKTVVRRLCKYLPKSPELIEALEASDADHRPDDPPDGLPELPPEATKTDKVAALVARRVIELKSNGNGHTEPPATEPIPRGYVQPPENSVAQVAVEAAAKAAAVVTVAEPIPPRTGLDLEQYALATECLAWFHAFGAQHGYPGRGLKVNLWSPGQVRIAWTAYQTEGMDAA